MTPPRLVARNGETYPIDEPRWCADDQTPLMVEPLPGITREDIDAHVNSQWCYAASLPVPVFRQVTLGEGRTPLVPLEIGGHAVAAKLEWLNPTGSFKDRGSAVMVSALAAQGVPALLEDSSGNGGSSVAAYCAAAGIEATIMAPESTSSAKLIAARAHGARVELIPGSRQDTADAALAASEHLFYASHNWHPAFLQGTKLLAYELWEDLGFHAPDAVITPVGAGSLVMGLWIGFSELLRSGEIARMPRIVGTQPANCSPLAEAFASGSEDVADGEWRPTLAEGTAIARPVRAREVLQAVRETEGAIVAVTEEEIVASTRELNRRGLYAEPTAATPAAALPRLIEDGIVDPAGRTVMILTGTGAKASEAMAKVLAGEGA